MKRYPKPSAGETLGGEVVSLILEGLQDSAQGHLVDDEEVWADVDRLLANHGIVRRNEGGCQSKLREMP